MTYVSDGAAINGLTLSTNFFYSATNEAAGVSSTNGVLDYNGTVVAGGVSGISGTITNLGNGFFNLTPTGGTATEYQILGSTSDGKNLIFETYSNNGAGSSSGPYFILSNSGMTPPTGNLNYDGNNSYTAPVCFVLGTRIETVRGQIAIEDLAIGDIVVTASGARRPIRWIGRRSYSGIFANRNPDVLPISFAAGSLGDNVPSRDLLVSPKHAMVLDGMLVPAEHLVNGTSITKTQRVDSLEYFHVELDSHDVLIAEGAESESYIDDDNRNFFHNGSDHRAAYRGAGDLRGHLLPAPARGWLRAGSYPSAPRAARLGRPTRRGSRVKLIDL